MDRATAEQIVTIMRDVSTRINTSIRIVMDNCTQHEFHRYRRLAGGLMGEIFLEILMPIYKEHTDLTPPELKQS